MEGKPLKNAFTNIFYRKKFKNENPMDFENLILNHQRVRKFN
jgi:hypothetical protein